MNKRAIDWAFEIELDCSTEKLVALTLAWFADDNGIAWPSVAAISRTTGLAVRTISRAVKRLETDAVIGVDRIPGEASSYRLPVRRGNGA